MNETEFWEIIENAGSPDTLEPEQQCEAIAQALTGKSIDTLVEFHNIHQRILARAYTWSLVEACLIIIRKEKVSGQWRLCCLVHNIEKLWRYGPQVAVA